MAAIIRAIEALNERIGRTVSWLAIILVFNTFLVAVLRYGFSRGWVWLQEMYVWMHAIIFLVVAGYTLLHEGHVRIDIFYGSASLRGKAWVNALGTVFLLWPTLIVIAWVAWPYVHLSWTRLESSQEAGGLPGLFLLKSCMLAFVVLVGLQGLALFMRSAMVLLGHPEWDPHSKQPAEH
ncbi:MAG: TRAP transporter small permease subunit [Hyphomicrobiaceae bacterium]|nr:TRAP transporter small permease subunit [Hyphomicrobiaceae bacterium]